MIAYQMRIEGVREATHEYDPKDKAKWGPIFTCSAPVPKEWRLIPDKCRGVPADVIENWERNIAAIREEMGEMI